MKKVIYIGAIFSLLASCSNNNGSRVAETATEMIALEEQVTVEVSSDPVRAVCIWDETSVRETATKKGKWKTSMSMGEKVTTTGETKEDPEDGKEFIQVTLTDGESGWARKDFIISGAYPAAILKEAVIYERPDLVTKSKKSFKQFDIVAIKSINKKFAEVVGKRRDGTWIDKGFIMTSNTTQDETDLVFAKFTGIALAEDDDSVARTKLDEILSNEMFQDSKFYVAVEEMYDSLNP